MLIYFTMIDDFTGYNLSNIPHIGEDRGVLWSYGEKKLEYPGETTLVLAGGRKPYHVPTPGFKPGVALVRGQSFSYRGMKKENGKFIYKPTSVFLFE